MLYDCTCDNIEQVVGFQTYLCYVIRGMCLNLERWTVRGWNLVQQRIDRARNIENKSRHYSTPSDSSGLYIIA